MGIATAEGSHQVANVLPGFLARYPDIQIDMDLSDRQTDLAEEGFDLAIRVTTQPPPHLAARRLLSIHRVVCAAPTYWNQHGRPQVPADLKHHNCIVYMPNPSFNQWYFIGPDSTETIAVNGNFKVNNSEAIIEAALGGLGAIMLTSFAVERDIQAGRLEPVLLDYHSPDTDIYALYLPNRYLSTKARVFIDYLVECFAKPPVAMAKR